MLECKGIAMLEQLTTVMPALDMSLFYTAWKAGKGLQNLQCNASHWSASG